MEEKRGGEAKDRGEGQSEAGRDIISIIMVHELTTQPSASKSISNNDKDSVLAAAPIAAARQGM